MSVQERVFQKIAELKGIDPSELSRDTNFLDIGADSLDMVELSIELDEAFGITISQQDISAIKTLGNAVDFIEKNKK
jgi:acyl carrier protein